MKVRSKLPELRMRLICKKCASQKGKTRFARQRIRLRYSPDMKEIFIVESDGTLTPIRLLNKTENALIKREKVHLCKGDE